MFERICPNCNKLLVYKNKRKFSDACKNNGICRSCSKKGDKNPMFGILGENNPKFGIKIPSLTGENNPSKRLEVRGKISEKKKGKPSSMLGKHHKQETIDKIKKSNRGKKRSIETIDKIRIARKKQVGEKCPSWKGGITPKVKLLRGCEDYKEWRMNVFKRDNFICKLCNTKQKYLESHHIIGVYENINLIFDQNNGITLCKKCHNNFHSKYGVKNFPNILIVEKLSI